MDIKILDSWLREYLETKANPAKIAECLSLCGPSVERIKNVVQDKLYEIEITTNRIDSASLYGIAREASAILPRFNIPARLKPVKYNSSDYRFVKSVPYLHTNIDINLCSRFTAVLIKNVNIGPSPKNVKSRLEASGIRTINNVIDISNYTMLLLGQPVHTFDYDKIVNKKMVLRESRKGEKITTLDDKEFTLPGGDIVIEDGSGKLIDLAGIMGGKLSSVDENTKNVLLFVQTYNPAIIRKTSMLLAHRTMAATIFEKGTDTELVTSAVLTAIEMFRKICNGSPEQSILDIYPSPPKTKKISVPIQFIENRLGVVIPKNDITGYLKSLHFEVKWINATIEVTVPSFRQNDIQGREDIVEEIARIHGYHNLPSQIMEGKLTSRSSSPQFTFEEKIKNCLSGWGGIEVYSLALVPKDYVTPGALRLKNPLGLEGEYLRTSLMPSILASARQNLGILENFHLFEIANIYLSKKNNLPEERLILAGIFEGYDYRISKGIVEALLSKLNIDIKFSNEEHKGFAAGKCAVIKSAKEVLGYIGYPENSKQIYYEMEIKKLFSLANKSLTYKSPSKYPPQVEDITLIFPSQTYAGNVVDYIASANKCVYKVDLRDVYKNSYTFRVWYHDANKTLTDTEVAKIRASILSGLKEKFGIEL